jgi:protein SCO1
VLRDTGTSVVVARGSSGGAQPDRLAPRWPVRGLALVALMIAGSLPGQAGASESPGLASRVQFASQPALIPDFALRNQNSDEVRFSQLRGGPLLVFFGFTNCQSVCPPAMQKLRQITRTLNADKVAITTVLISVDGERDSPAVMKAYLEPFMPGFVGLTGDPVLVREIAAGFPAVFFKGIPRNERGDYDVEHTSQVYLVDAQGRLTATFYNATAEEMSAAVRQAASRDY